MGLPNYFFSVVGNFKPKLKPFFKLKMNLKLFLFNRIPDAVEEEDVADVQLDLPDARTLEQHRVHDVLLCNLGSAEGESEDVVEVLRDVHVEAPRQVPGLDQTSF